ncbi:MAG TPA: ABC transporter permease [Nakamurella sp.]|nr:ABC transporter permease [Nakamurella sp.]
MIPFIVRRLLISVVVLCGISIALFGLLKLMPGDPAEMMLDPLSFQGDRAAALGRLRAELGLDKAIPVQYVSWMGELLHGNLGFSYTDGRPVGQIIVGRLGTTALLMGSALLIALVVGIPVGIIAALRRNTWVDYSTTFVSLLAISVPSFFLGLVGIYVLGIKLRWFPVGGLHSTGASGLGDLLYHLALPAAILGFALAGPYVRYARASMLEVLGQDYLTTARSKGLTARQTIRRHGLPNALIPLITVIAIQIPILLGGAVVIEQIFALPGLGTLVLDAIQSRNYPIVLAFVMVVAVLVLLCNLIADVAYAVIDPRIRV